MNPVDRMDDITFCKNLPKTELHAHITGSIMPNVLHEIWKDQTAKDPDYDFGDPVEVLETACKDMDSLSFFPLFSKVTEISMECIIRTIQLTASEFIYRLCNTRAHIQTCTRSVLADFARDGVEYLELRSIPRPASDISKEGYVQTVLEVLNDTTIVPRPARAYLILGVDRKLTSEEAFDTVDLAIKYKSQGVVGVDLAGNPTKSSVTHFHDVYKKARDAGLKVTLHFAEAEFSSQDEELKALLDYQPDRLGHLVYVPQWAKEVIQERKIGLELCLTSNVARKLISGGYPSHHFGEWKMKGCPIAICTDDVGVFRSTVSQEYLILMKHFGLSRKEIIDLSRSSVNCIFGTEEDKEEMLKKLDEFEKISS